MVSGVEPVIDLVSHFDGVYAELVEVLSMTKDESNNNFSEVSNNKFRRINEC